MCDWCRVRAFSGFWAFALGPCGCLVVGNNFVRVDLHVLARFSCCGAVIVGGHCPDHVAKLVQEENQIALLILCREAVKENAALQQAQDLNHVLPSSCLAGGEVFSC